MNRCRAASPGHERALRRLKRLALERGVNQSVLFQELIADYLARVSTLSARDWHADPFFQVGRRPGRSGRAGVAENHDRHLYRARH